MESGIKPKGTIDLISEQAVLIDSSCPQDFLFASDEEDDGQEVSFYSSVLACIHVHVHATSAMCNVNTISVLAV